MLSKLYAKWMYAWETALTTRDTNRIVRPLEWGFDWLQDFSPLAAASHAPAADDFARMIAVNADIVARAEEFFGRNPSGLRKIDAGRNRRVEHVQIEVQIDGANPPREILNLVSNCIERSEFNM